MEIVTAPPTTKAPAAWFTGDVWFDVVAAPPPPARLRVNLVRFAPGARTFWHSHAVGQSLRVTQGVAGWAPGTASSWRSGPARPCGARPARSTGTVRAPMVSWSTWRCGRPPTPATGRRRRGPRR